MAGLSRSKNLSENNLNLKTALQKLYAPGIEDDIELFSLSSQITSTIIGGPQVLSSNDPLSQIYSVESQKIKVSASGGTTVTLDRTKFNTRYFTYTNDNKVYFDKYTLTTGSSSNAIKPIFSSNGSVPATNLIYGGRGFYFLNTDKTVYSSTATEITLKSVEFIGEISNSSTLKADVVFEKESAPPTSEEEEYKLFTPASTNRYRIKSISITSEGSGYLIPEKLTIVEDKEYEVSGSSPTVKVLLKKQRATLLAFTEPIVKTALYYYLVKDADATGFFLYDENLSKYIFLDLNDTTISNNEIQIKRSDSIRIENLLQFKFAGSNIYLDGYGDSYSIGASISGELSGLGNSVQNLITSVRTGIQNAKLPTLASSNDNTLGYKYNEFEGRNVTIWQRVVIRDEDFLLDPGAVGSRTGLTGTKLKDDVSNFELDLTASNTIKVPGLFIKVGTKYYRAFSTSDKPFFAKIGTSIANPNLSNNRSKTDTGALSAEGYDASSSTWYGFNTQIAKLAQRIHSNGKDGAFYFHKKTAPTVTTISISKGGTSSSIYSVPLFKVS